MPRAAAGISDSGADYLGQSSGVSSRFMTVTS